MKVFIKEFTVTTRSRFEVVDITDLVESVVSSSGVSDGIVVVHVPHATAAVMLNEAEPNLFRDYIDMVKELFKPDAPWKHNMIDNNAHAHLAAAVIGSSRVIPLRSGRMLRGTWQNILLLELDGPRHRRVVVEVMGV